MKTNQKIPPKQLLLNLRLNGQYDSNLVASKIIEATNIAVNNGFKIDSDMCPVAWDVDKKYWRIKTQYFSYKTTPLGAVLFYSNSSYRDPKANINTSNHKNKAIAEILNVNLAYLRGFQRGYSVWAIYTNNKCKYYSPKLRNQFNDGFELGKIFRFAFLGNDFSSIHFYRTSEILYKTHKWKSTNYINKYNEMNLEFDKKTQIKQCSECNIYGLINKEIILFKNSKHTDSNFYVNSSLTDNKIHYSESYDLSCKDTLIKEIIK